MQTRPMMSFHSKHGTNIRLLDNGTVAERNGEGESVAFTKHPIPIGTLLEVKIIELEIANSTNHLVSIYTVFIDNHF